MSIELRLDDFDELETMIARAEHVRLRRISDGHWLLRVGTGRERVTVHFETAGGSGRIRASFSKDTDARK